MSAAVLVAIILGIVVLGGGAYWYMQNQKGSTVDLQTPEISQTTNSPQPQTTQQNAPATSQTSTGSVSDPRCPTLTHDFGLGATDAQTEGDLGRLISFLDSHDYYGDARTDGTFNEQTSAALSAWQKSAGLDGLGVVGPKTRAAIAQACNQ